VQPVSVVSEVIFAYARLLVANVVAVNPIAATTATIANIVFCLIV
jgi:uncharacterized membrane protein YtjA (UPF0391 family)